MSTTDRQHSVMPIIDITGPPLPPSWFEKWKQVPQRDKLHGHCLNAHGGRFVPSCQACRTLRPK